MQEPANAGNVMCVTRQTMRGPGTGRVSLPTRADGALGGAFSPCQVVPVRASVPSRNNDRAGRRDNDDGLVENPRGRLPTLGLSAADDPGFEGELAAAAADLGQDRRCLQD